MKTIFCFTLFLLFLSCGMEKESSVYPGDRREYDAFPHGEFAVIDGEVVDIHGNFIAQEEFSDSLWSYITDQDSLWVVEEHPNETTD